MCGLLVLIGLAAFNRGEGLASQPVLGIGAVLLGLAIPPYCWKQARHLFETAWYSALGGMAAGELMGELSETAPGPEYVGGFFVDWLPPSHRPWVARDLKQAWRRSRVDHLSLGLLSFFLLLMAFLRRASFAESGLVFPSLTLVMALAGAQAFRFSRPQSDAGWLWLSLPGTLRLQVESRVLSTVFFPVMVLPVLWLSLVLLGYSWVPAALWLAVVGAGASLLSVNLSLSLFTKQRLGATLYGIGMILAAGGGLMLAQTEGVLPWGMALAVLMLGATSLLLLRRLPEPWLQDTPTR